MRGVAVFSVFLSLTAGMIAFPRSPGDPVAGKLQITYLVTSDDASRFAAMWLEDERGEMVKTLYVSKELSGGAFTVDGDICPDWVKKAHWEKATQDEVDAVSGPTPTVGTGSRSFDLKKLGVAPGMYFFCMQLHLHDNYNILFKGQIRLGDKPAEAQAEVFYSPGKLTGAENLLRDVRAQFTPGP